MAVNPSRYHFLMLALLSSMAVLGLLSSVNLGLASLHYYHVRNTVDAWRVDPSQRSEQQYLVAKQTALVATQSQQNNALYQDLLAQVIEWGAVFSYEEQELGLNAAKAHYLRASELRPYWPVTWASLVMVKWRQQQLDDELLLYLQTAANLGPQKPEVHTVIVEFGLALYRANHPFLLHIRPEFYRRLALGLKNPQSRQQIIHLIQQYQATNLVCRWLKDEPRHLKQLIPGCH
jgi:hypothetical protein